VVEPNYTFDAIVDDQTDHRIYPSTQSLLEPARRGFAAPDYKNQETSLKALSDSREKDAEAERDFEVMINYSDLGPLSFVGITSQLDSIKMKNPMTSIGRPETCGTVLKRLQLTIAPAN
jgi:hypothetical protein